MTADQFTAAGNPSQTQPRDSSAGLARVELAAQRTFVACARAEFEAAAGYHGHDSPQAQAALEELRAAARPGARGELVPATPEVPSLREDEAMARLRAADPASRRQQAAVDPKFVNQVVTEVMSQLPRQSRAARGELVPATREVGPSARGEMSQDEAMSRLRSFDLSNR